ncbi:MAG: CDP-alcohol phosphatidyltransferase family protein [Candidatus Omnitrophica bacterium]|nr:CDP-alcohol phosphatidyltransferase family protein [Candidatus Omnitrophota bacterium]
MKKGKTLDKNGMNVANILTFSRIFVIPLLLWLIFKGYIKIFLYLFVIAAVTDFLDGYFARKTGCISDFGRKLDPIADKTLIISMLFGLYFFCKTDSFSIFPIIVPIIVLIRDLFIVIGFIFFMKIEPKLQLNPTIIGKITTFFQFLLILCVFYTKGINKSFLIALTLIFTVVSGLDYFRIALMKRKKMLYDKTI